MTYTLLIPQYLNWVVKNMTLVEMYMSSVERIENYVRLPSEAAYREEQAKSSQLIPFISIGSPGSPSSPNYARARWPHSGGVAFENITLKYDTSNQPVLNGVDIVIKPGEKVNVKNVGKDLCVNLIIISDCFVIRRLMILHMDSLDAKDHL